MRRIPIRTAPLVGLFCLFALAALEQRAFSQAPTTPVPTRLSQVPYGESIRLVPVELAAPTDRYVTSLRRAHRVRLTGAVFLTLGFAGLLGGVIGSYAADDGDSCEDSHTTSSDSWDSFCIDFGPGFGAGVSAGFAAPFIISGALMIGLGGRRKREAERALGIEIGLRGVRASIAF